MKRKSPLPKEQCDLLFTYDPDTGDLRWKTSGEIAGWVENTGYRRVKVFGERYIVSRIAWTMFYGAPPDGEVDHINGNRADDRICNMRECSASQNSCNRKRPSHNTTGFKGVQRAGKSFRARIMKNGETIDLGCFPTARMAFERRLTALAKLHGEFARPV